ncbi:MAG: cupin domain-containing protein [Thermoleophilia bacterium]|nr:cupin domain-containing protein [Thermoleophilia bacterium]
MAARGERLENPVTGERLVWRATSAETGGTLLAFDFSLRVGGSVPLAHVHPLQEERFRVLAGRARVRLGGRTVVARPGDEVVVPPGTVHRLWNDGEEELQAVIEFRPALRLEQFFEQLWGLARDGRLDKRGLPSPLQLAVMAPEYLDEVALPVVPVGVQRAALALVAPLARARGYAAFDPAYGPRL